MKVVRLGRAVVAEDTVEDIITNPNVFISSSEVVE
jgi:hypothetical protein